MTCQARVLDKEMKFPYGDVRYHTTKECGEIARHKHSVDDGDAFMGLCGDCLRRCLTKKGTNSRWYGFFDCEYPEQAKVRGSPWYFWQLSLAQEQADDATRLEEAEAEAEEPPQQVAMEEAEAAELIGSPKQQIQPPPEEEEEEEERTLPKAEDPSEKQLVETTIAQLKATVKASPNMPVKDQAKILKEIMDLRFRLKQLKKTK
jgi:hypothetical protein